MVTDRRRLGEDWASALTDRVQLAAELGVGMVQVREPGLEAGHLCALVARLVQATDGSGMRILVNDRADVARAASAAGVHLPEAGAPAVRVRACLQAGAMVGRSVHDVAVARAAASDGGLDYLLFGTVFPSRSKPGREAAGLVRLAEVVLAVPVPVLAIGGVTASRAGDVAATGAAGFGAIGLFLDGTLREARENVRRALTAFDTLRPLSP